MSEKTFKVRDLRKKEQFIIDDSYLNGYAKLVSPYATCVYLSLCRHANKEQRAFPGQARIARQHSISKKSVKKGIRELIAWNIIKKNRVGKRLNNEYWLLDKSEWKPVSVKAPREPSPKHNDFVDFFSDSSNRPRVIDPTEPNDSSRVATKDTQGGGT